MSRLRPALTAAIGAACLLGPDARAQSLRGSSESVERQHGVAIENDFTFLSSARDVSRFVKLGLLVPVGSSADVQLAGVSFPYARPAVRTFIQRLGAQYRGACGEPMVVTSLTRPENRQPRNASVESVHPAGMAVDLRVSGSSRCRAWLERVLLSLEDAGVLEATRERRPPHYHIAVFPSRYEDYVRQLTTRAVETVASGATGPTGGPSDDPAGATEGTRTAARYRVRRGDSLWDLARRFGTTVEDLQAMNGLDHAGIRAGDYILVPAR